MMSTKDVVVKHRPSRVNDITDQQIAYIPRWEEDQIECSMPYYVFEGRKVALNPKEFIIFKLRYLRFNENMNSIKRRNYRSCNEPLMKLIDKAILRPFMFFINGLFIPWIAIRIVIDNDNYYLIVEGSRAKGLYSLCESYDFVQMFSIPDHMGYTHDPKNIMSLSERPAFMFRQDLTYTFVAKEAKYAIFYNNSPSSINRLDSNYNHLHTNGTINATRLYDNNEKIKVSEKNIFLFIDGSLHYGQPNRVKRCTINGDNLDYHHSGNVRQNISVRVDGNLLSVNKGVNTSNLTFDVVFFKNNDYTSDNLDNVMRISEEARMVAVRSSNNGTNLPYFQKLSVPFNLNIDRSSFDSHIEQSESFIMGYNPYLYNDLVKSYATIDISELSGADVLKAAKKSKSNVLSAALNNDGVYEERLLLFVNGILHVNHSLAVTDKNTMRFPIDSTISANDIVEIMRFKNVNNSVVTITIHESDGFVYQCNPVINSDMLLFCRTPNISGVEYPENGFQNFEVEYTLEQNEDGYIRIVLSDPFYYGKELTVVSRNRFVYRNYRITRNGTDTVNMGSHFRYCTDLNRYMLFVNGRLLNRDQYEITIPSDPASGKYQFMILLYTKLNTSDKFDVVYSSTELEDIITQDKLDPSGNIVAQDPSVLDYALSKELYMVWLNGKKIPASQLDDINTRCISINTDQATMNNLRVIKHIKCDILRGITHNGFIWDDAIFNSGLTNDEISAIIGKENVDFTDTEPNYGNKTAELTIDISSSDICIISDTKSIMTFDIEGDIGILTDPGGSLKTTIEKDILYIDYEGS